MTAEIDEARLRRSFAEAVARYQSATARQPANWSDAWLAATEAARHARGLCDFWEAQALEWLDRANQAPPEE